MQIGVGPAVGSNHLGTSSLQKHYF